MTHALIIGGGVSGLALAMALQRVGFEATVYERNPIGAWQRGAWLTFQANGMDALAAIAADRPVQGLGFDVDTISFINGKGKLLGRRPLAAPRSDGQVSQVISRADLYRVLGETARQCGSQLHYGKQLVEAKTTAAGVRACFADGTTADGDLLIGCDGIRSRVRQLIDPHARRPRYVPLLNVGGYIPDFSVDVPPREFRMQFGTRCFFAWMSTPDNGTVWFANPPMAREPERGVLASMEDAQWRAWLHKLMVGDVGPAHDIIDAAPGPLLGWATYDMPVVRRWHRDGMIIIGDAAHATAPSAGQGASMALEDAVILAQCLRDCPDIHTSFATFEALRRKRVERIVRYGTRSANVKAAGPLGRVIRDLLLPIVFRRQAYEGGRSMTWLQGHHIDFERPVTCVSDNS
ncbi:FAD-dependent oxidoreductase [Mycobacteroides abscessus]|uniref:FAD-dependent oxidoreductase n=1 Tax=Mycobacteroides abscessus TaxID=36809 RepID=UPI0009A60BA8|nr:NAD(P)/FAD-dependent oxidoreductase [Mycobacteroides abscessus]SLF47574.1 2-polyprenyl-6-methoxyphenol hydroxylase-like oxidoreductase [Mycobacteroides abscessus subsp. abscessus]